MNDSAEPSQDNTKIYRDLTGGLTDSGTFKAIYEVRGEGRPLKIGQEIVLRTPEGDVCGKVIDSSKEGKAWYALVESRKAIRRTKRYER